jgi:hypothetical protein
MLPAIINHCFNAQESRPGGRLQVDEKPAALKGHGFIRATSPAI